ncbi:MAG TPA: [Fe-Fe] hydrogenase large subunit C-terminal domain-containing protein [Sedimentisphaerales bacterium]|nr:[Fe-Fe] hydrogenase large subunit C-terminal domain-containing protein [Sedimentisphaerales bacterium]
MPTESCKLYLMEFGQSHNQIVFTNRARCRDCYRCLRVCPVEAIGIRDGQAFVDERRCVSCGTCIRECPQKAKCYRKDLAAAMELVQNGRAAVSLAPSFACLFEDWEVRRIPSALRKLGFTYVAETASGAEWVAAQTAEYVRSHAGQLCIATACPAVVHYVQRYRPELSDKLVPVISPMAAHGRAIKARLWSDVKVVFIGPCVAKKSELQTGAADSVDAALTFEEMFVWFELANIKLSDFEESSFDESPARTARLFPLEGGCLKTASLPVDYCDTRNVSVSGFESICDALDGLSASSDGCLLEPLFCSQGCINGPVMGCHKPLLDRKQSILRYMNHSSPGAASVSPVELVHTFQTGGISDEAVTEEQIRRVLEKTGKQNPDDQLNCGACGYQTCRQQAIAVLRQMAEPEMCISWMRRLAERRTDRIIETSPNGIVTLDAHLTILHVNSSFKRLFMCTDAVCGKPVSYLMDPAPFQKVASGQQELFESAVHHEKYNLYCHEIIYALQPEGQLVGIFVNLTRAVTSKRQYDQLQAQTLEQARNLLRHQVDMAGKIAEYLGQSTAAGEKLLVSLMQIAQNPPAQDKGSGGWLNGIYTSK